MPKSADDLGDDMEGSATLHQCSRLPAARLRKQKQGLLRTDRIMSALKGAVDMRSCAFRGASPALGLRPVCIRVPRRSLQTSNAVKEIFMPALSSTMTEGKIVSWLKGPGDKVSKGESVVVVESDKADMDVESFNDGIIGAIVIPEGGVANVGDPIAFIAESADDMEEAKSKAGSSSNGAAPAAVEKPAVAEVVHKSQLSPGCPRCMLTTKSRSRCSSCAIMLRSTVIKP